MKLNKIVALLVTIAMTLSIVGVMPTMVSAATYSNAQYYADSIAEYSQHDLSDPQHITDEDFFGVWDAETETWSDEPMFDYFRFPKMSAVEEAAKLGDYENCKEELLAYYREKHKGYAINGEFASQNVSAQSRAQYEMALDNFVRMDYTLIAGKANFNRDYSWDTTDVLSLLNGIRSSGTANKNLKFLLACGKKDGYRVEIKNEGQYRPYLTATINGVQQTFYPTVTTYVDASEPDKSHADSDTLLVEESVTSIGAPTTVDENTKNALLHFDFPDLRQTDQISGAYLHMYGRFVEDDVPDAPRFENRDYKSVYLIRWTAVTALDKNLTWNKYVPLITHYRSLDGEPAFRFIETDASNSYLTNIGTTITFSTDGYFATGEEAFAFHAVRSFIEVIKGHGDYEQLMSDYAAGKHTALGLAAWGFTLVWTLDKIIHSKHMTPEAYTIIMKKNYEMGRWGAENWPKHFEGVNHGAYGVNGLETICFMYPEFAPVDEPLKTNEDGSLYFMDPTLYGSVTGGWLAVANHRRGIKAMSDIKDDGASIEGSTSYAMEGIGNYLEALDYGEKLGIDNTGCYTNEEANAKIEQGLMYVISKLNPMLGDMQVGDCHGWTSKYSSLARFRKIFPDNPYLEYIVEERTSGLEPPFLTMAYDSVATAVFRNSWADDYAIAAHFEARGGGSHNHNDDGNLVLFAYGNYLLVDPRNGDYNEEDPYERWVSSSRGHNTVEINNTVGRGYRQYAVQQEPLVFAYDEDGNPKIDENGVVMMDDPLIVPINQVDYRPGYLFPEDREINPVYDYMRAESKMFTDNNAFKEDFNFERDVLFLRTGYFVVVDRLSPEFGEINGSNHYKQQWHFLPDANITVDKDKNVIRTNFNGRANVILASVKNNDTVTAQYKYGLYAPERSMFTTVKYGTFEQDKVGDATFNTLVYPVRQDKDADITTTKLLLDLDDNEANAFKASVVDSETKKTNDIYFYSLFDYDKKAPMIFGAYETDGTLALGDKKEKNYENAVLRNGSYLKNIIDNEYPIYSEEEISDIGVYWQNDVIDIAYNVDDEYNNELNLSKLTIRANGTVKTVKLNGEEIEFSQKGRYIYFSETPILDVEEIVPAPGENGDDSGSSADHGTAGDSSTGNNNSNTGNTNRPSDSSTGSGTGGGKDNPPKSDTPKEEPKLSDTFKKELKDHWAQNEITSLIDSEIIQGLGDGTLGLSNNITRAEFITMLARALDVEIQEYNDSFKDVLKDSWYAPYVETALANGWASGDGENFHPERNITREEITKILVSAFEQKHGEIVSETKLSFDDKDLVSTWAEEYVNKAVSAGIINGMGDNKFMPKDSAKREQAMVLIYRLINNNE